MFALPRWGLGSAALGNLYTAVSDEDARATVDACWDAGIRYVDTAPHYGLGLAEERVGAALRDRPRDGFVLQTKVGRLLVPTGGDAAGRDTEGFDVPATRTRVWDFSAAGVRRSIEDSLERLGLDRVDVALVHDPDDHLDDARRGAFPELLRMREEGIVRAVGAGMNETAPLTAFVEEFDLDVVLVAGRYHLLDASAATDLFPAAQRGGTAVVLGGVFASGLLAHDDPPPESTYAYAQAPADLVARARRIAQVAREHGTTLPALAVQHALAHPAVASVVLGMRSPAEVHRNAGLFAPAPAGVWEALDREGLVAGRVAA
ncbi:aldo/keto reductase [Kineococcus rhizosphaerae]|uniref:D-threo-aldose 1-dehydrogenase n=1 Tax=Kineococcus rhizosphaerae TaxID=559628 RepID=A0A2T0R0P0_9ACTN|nr:aldo/keto reductase [Kineococcus rhizosphaerae]PRY12849.1 D-threo-aldose 1-dehydrogenase [Kineococcus rhizosphaerae]